MAAALDAAALIRAVERPESDEARLLDRVAAGKLKATCEAADLAAVSGFFEEHRSRAFAWAYDTQLRRILTVSGAAGARPAQAEAVDAVYGRRDLTRSLIFSLVVGTALVLINVRPGQTTGNPADGPDLGRIFLNYLVPFLVASTSAAFANYARIRAARR